MIATHMLIGHDGSRDAESAFEDALEERNVTLETLVLVGHPADEIVKPAARQGGDLIVVGHRGRSAIRDWMSGSTSRRVFTHAACPVLVVRAR